MTIICMTDLFVNSLCANERLRERFPHHSFASRGGCLKHVMTQNKPHNDFKRYDPFIYLCFSEKRSHAWGFHKRI